MWGHPLLPGLIQGRARGLELRLCLLRTQTELFCNLSQRASDVQDVLALEVAWLCHAIIGVKELGPLRP